MDHAGLLIGFAFAEQAIEPCKAIGMDRAGIACKMVGGVLAFSINAELIPAQRTSAQNGRIRSEMEGLPSPEALDQLL